MKIYGKNQDGVTIHGDDDAPLASLYFLGKRETYANGRLMEAAPKMYKAMKEIAAMEPEEYETEVECAHPTMTACGTCLEMRDIAREVLKEIDTEQ